MNIIREAGIREIISKSLSSIVVRFIGLLAGLSISIFIGNYLGAEALGRFALSVKILELLCIVGTLGIGEILMKEVAIGIHKDDVQTINRHFKSSSLLITVFSVFLLSCCYVFVDTISKQLFNDEELASYLRLFIVISLIRIWISIISQTLKGLKKTWQAIAIKDALPIILLALITWGYSYTGRELDLYFICNTYIYTHLFVFLISIVLLNRKFNWSKVPDIMQSKFFKSLLLQGFPLLIVTSFVLINSFIDIFMLSSLSGIKEVGLYSVASRLAFFINFVLIMSGGIIAPKIAQAYATRDRLDLIKTIRFSSSSYLILGLIAVMMYFLFGPHILSFWGPEFKESYTTLVILSIGYFVNLILGISTFLLSMTGNQKILGWLSFVFGGLNIILNYVLIKQMGALGAALATSIILILDNLVKSYVAFRKTGFYPVYYLKTS